MIVFVMALVGCMAAPDMAVRPAAAASVADLAWLAGTWVTAEDPVTEEVWMPPAAGTMMGVNRTMSGGRTVHHEYLRLEERDAGVYYIADPKGQDETEFLLVEHSEQRAVFENPAHDFPQRLTYTRVADALTADVEGGGKGFSIAWLSAGAGAEAEVRQALDTYRAALNAGDYETALQSYADTPEFYWVEDGQIRYESVAEIAAAFKGLKGYGGVEVTYSDTEVTVLSADQARVFTTHSTTVGGEGGFTFAGAMTLTMERTDTGWKIVAGHTSTARPPR